MATRHPDTAGRSEQLQPWLERLRARAGALEQDLGDLICALPDTAILVDPVCAPIGPMPTLTARTRTKRRKWSDPMFARLAEPGVTSLEISPLDRRHSIVSINGAAGLPMPIEQADFLRTIAQTEDAIGAASTNRDEFAPWQNKDAIALARGCSPHAIDVMVGRLRDRLWNDFRVSPLLVENRAARVRFRLRRARPDARVTCAGPVLHSQPARHRRSGG